jgi:elongation factor G
VVTRTARTSREPMSVRSSVRGQAGRVDLDPAPDAAGVRNVALIGRSGVGKTTLAEHLLAVAGVLGRPGSVSEGTTVSDRDPIEIAQQRSVFLSACPLRWNGTLINLLDAPGFGDFIGELRAGLRAADAVLFIVSAADPIDAAVLELWRECAGLDIPRAVAVNRLDVPRADLRGALDACRDAFGADGDTVLPLYELRPDQSGLVGLLESESAGSAADRGALIDAIITESEDEALLEQYLGGDAIDPGALVSDLHTATSRGHLHPAIPVCAPTGLGLTELLDLVVAAFPSPQERPLPTAWTPIGAPGPELRCDPDGPLAAEVVRAWVDPYVGRVSLLRIFSGTIHPDTPLHVSGHGGSERGHPDHDADEKTATLLSTTMTPIDSAGAGNLCVVARLSTAETGNTVSDQSRPLVILPWPMPEPLLPVAVRPATRNDEDALAKALHRLTAADPTVRLERNADTGQLVLWCLGDAHADVVLSRLRSGGAGVEIEPVRVSLQSTFGARATGLGRHVKQSGGHGQFAVCRIEVEPLPRGAGIEFVDAVVGGTVPRQFIPSVEKGVRTQLAEGLTPGAPVVDVRVTLIDGKAHSVDSSDAAFQVAGALAIKDATTHAQIQLLEPVDSVDITVTEDHIGEVLSDLSGRRGRVTGTEPATEDPLGGHSVIHAEVPGAELVRYAAVLRSITGGAGSFTRHYLRHDPAPPSISAALLDSAS